MIYHFELWGMFERHCKANFVKINKDKRVSSVLRNTNILLYKNCKFLTIWVRTISFRRVMPYKTLRIARFQTLGHILFEENERFVNSSGLNRMKSPPPPIISSF